MRAKLISVWVWLSIALPAVFGLMALFNAKMMIDNVGAVGLAHQGGIRQLVYAGVLLIAWRSLGVRAAGVILAGRGVTDLADGIDGLVTGGFNPMLMFPILTSFISFWVAWLLLRAPQKDDPTPAR